MKDCIDIDETVSLKEPKLKKKNKELHIKPKKKFMQDKELDTIRKNYKYGAENDDDEGRDFAWEDGIEREEHVSKGEKIKSTPWNTGRNVDSNDDNGEAKDEPEPREKMGKGKRKALVMMLAKKKMKSQKNEDY